MVPDNKTIKSYLKIIWKWIDYDLSKILCPPLLQLFSLICHTRIFCQYRDFLNYKNNAIYYFRINIETYAKYSIFLKPMLNIFFYVCTREMQIAILWNSCSDSVIKQSLFKSYLELWSQILHISTYLESMSKIRMDEDLKLETKSS